MNASAWIDGHCGAQTGRQIGKVERSGNDVQYTHPDDIHRCADGPHDEVLVGRQQSVAIAAQGNQRVGRQRGDFEENKRVESIARDHDAEQASKTQQVHGIEP